MGSNQQLRVYYSKRPSIILGVLGFVCVALVCTLFFLSKNRVPTGGGFERAFLSGVSPIPLDTIDLEFDSYYMAGKATMHLYFGNLVAAGHLLTSTVVPLDTQHVRLVIENSERLKFRAPKVKIDSPDVFIGDGAAPVIFRGSLSGVGTARSVSRLAYFLDYEPVGKASFAIRSLSPKKEARLGRLSYSPFSLDFKNELLKRQVDGVLCTEGQLYYDNHSRLLIYLYHYRNQYLVMDSSLTLLQTRKTIDTTSFTAMQVTTVSSSDKRTFLKPPVVSNRSMAVSDGLLYVNSGVMGDNEAYEDFASSAVIDVYDLLTGDYCHSFYIPGFNGHKVREFEVMNGVLIALYRRHIVSYDI